MHDDSSARGIIARMDIPNAIPRNSIAFPVGEMFVDASLRQ